MIDWISAKAERKANPLHLRQIVIWHISQEHREWDIGGILSLAANEAGKKREALVEPHGRCEIALS